MGCLRLTYQENGDVNFFQGLWKKSDGQKNCDKYYPFGLQTANSWTRENTTDNNFLFNGGTELNTTTGVMDLFYRNYDPALGRMNQVDPMASKLSSLTPYNYSGNSPVVYNDPKGDLFNGKAVCSWCDRGAGGAGGFDPWSGRIQDNGTAGGGIGLYGNSSYLSLSRSDRNFFVSSYNTLMNSPFAQASFAITQNGVTNGFNLLLNVTGQVIFAARDKNVTLASNGGWLASNSTTVSDYGSGVSFTTGLTTQANGSRWNFSALAASMPAAISTSEAPPLAIGIVVLGTAISLYESLNPNAKNLIPSKGIPWTEPQREYNENGGGPNNPSGGVKNLIIGLGILDLMSEMGKINSPLNPSNWNLNGLGNGINNQFNQTVDYFNGLWNTTIQGINNTNNWKPGN